MIVSYDVGVAFKDSRWGVSHTREAPGAKRTSQEGFTGIV